MKTIGLIGGMSWESSIEYYRIINQAVRKRLGGHHSARCILYSVDFCEILALEDVDDWPGVAEVIIDAAEKLEQAGADFVVLCTNTMHALAGEIQARIDLPLLHIADAAAERVKAAGLSRVGLLGTLVTMEEDFYKGRLAEKHGLEVMVPDAQEREEIDRVIFEELVLGEIREESRARLVAIIERLAAGGAQGMILGCTEIELLVKAGDCRVPLFDTARIHALAAVEEALGE